MNKASELSKLVRAARKSLGLNGESQRILLRKVREAFELTNDELAQALGYSQATLMAYLAPTGTAKARNMPEADKLILSRILAEKRAK